MVEKEQEQRLIEAEEDNEAEAPEQDPESVSSADWQRKHAREIGALIRRCYERQRQEVEPEQTHR